MIFFIFVFVSLAMVAGTFSNLAPIGANPENIANITKPTPPVTGTDQCNVVTLCLNMLIGPLINFVSAGWSMTTGFMNIGWNMVTFNIPAFSEMGSMGLLFRTILFLPTLMVFSLLFFFIIKSVIPTVGGNAE